jgi:NAD(P)-dependent dehydrogenase (short-subunit alcohol dehydrogenase family)
MMHINLKNKNILVTGASRGIGKAIAEKLASCGAKVALHFNENESRALKVQKELGNKGVIFQADFTNAMEVNGFFYNVLKKMKHIDILINNAGVAIQSDPAGNDLQWMDDWLRTMDVNLNAVALLCKKAIEHFVANKGGTIINMASRAAFRGDTKDFMAYAASKGGVVALTRSIARAYGKQGVIAFNVAPGFVRTDMAEDFIRNYGEEHAMQDVALSRMTEPEDIAPLVAFLCSGMADHATGSTFDVNAGSYPR